MYVCLCMCVCACTYERACTYVCVCVHACMRVCCNEHYSCPPLQSILATKHTQITSWNNIPIKRSPQTEKVVECDEVSVSECPCREAVSSVHFV